MHEEKEVDSAILLNKPLSLYERTTGTSLSQKDSVRKQNCQCLFFLPPQVWTMGFAIYASRQHKVASTPVPLRWNVYTQVYNVIIG